MAAENGSSLTALLVEDPELGAALAEAELEQAQRLLVVPTVTVGVGPWDASQPGFEPSLGQLVLDGLMTVNVALGDLIASDLAGPGDVLHAASAADVFLPAQVTHFASEPTRIAILDRRFIAVARRWPALLLALHERLRAQERRRALHAAIGRLRRGEDRVLAVLWHLAERWGRITPEGVVVPLALTHETLGRLTGAARPTVSLALTELARAGAVERRADGAFLLIDSARRHLEPAAERGPARPLAVVRTPDAGTLADAGTQLKPGLVDITSLRRRIAALHDELPARTREVEAVLATSAARTKRSSDLRRRAAADRDRRHSG